MVKQGSTYRTMLHGTCLVGGRHPEGSDLWLECPVVKAAERGRKRALGVPLRAPRMPQNKPRRPQEQVNKPTEG